MIFMMFRSNEITTFGFINMGPPWVLVHSRPYKHEKKELKRVFLA
jgi:hypothetical protein